MPKHHNHVLNGGSVLAFFFVAILLLFDLRALTLSWPLGILALFTGYVLADVTSGLVHFLGDTFGSESTPLLGKTFIFPFREHHRDQYAITRHDFFVTNGHNCLVSLPVMLLMHFFLAPHLASSALMSFVFLTGFSLVMSVFATNQIHKWAHLKKPPKVIAFLQKTRVILNPTHHALHHTAPYNRYFCITTGWMNVLLEKVRNSKRSAHKR